MAPRVLAQGPVLWHVSYHDSLNPGKDKIFYNQFGTAESYTVQYFDVPKGAQRLDADITWNDVAQPSSSVLETLFDPSGSIAKGTLFVDTFPQTGLADTTSTGDVVDAIPYKYRVE